VTAYRVGQEVNRLEYLAARLEVLVAELEVLAVRLEAFSATLEVLQSEESEEASTPASD